jgi:hypothetical protein
MSNQQPKNASSIAPMQQWPTHGPQVAHKINKIIEIGFASFGLASPNATQNLDNYQYFELSVQFLTRNVQKVNVFWELRTTAQRPTYWVEYA